ncbi:MAG: MFS transporter [Anaerolineae bacterium]|nr:MFS transporter [Anaerolineae bacterium]
MTNNSSPALTTTRYPPAFYLALAANFFLWGSFQWTYVTVPGYVQALGGDAVHIGLATGLATLSAILVRPLLSPLVDRRGRKWGMLLGAILFAVEPLLYTLASSIWPFLAARLLRGIGIGAFTIAYTALVADVAPPARRGEAIGLSGVTNNLGMLFLPAAGAQVQAWWGFEAHFWAATAIAVVSLLLVLPLTEPRGARAAQGSGHTSGPGFWAVARQQAVWTAALGGTGLAVAYGVALSFMPPLAEARGLTAAGTYFTAFAVAMMLTQSGAGWLSDRVGRRAVALPGMLCAALATAGLVAAHSNAALIAAGAGLGLSWGLVRAGLDTAIVEAVPPQARSSAVGVLYTLFDAGIGVGSFGLGLLAETAGYAAAFWAAAAWALVALGSYVAAGHGGAAASE